MKWIRWRSSPICLTLVSHFQVIMEMVIFVIWQPFAISPPSGQKKTNCCSFKIKEISTYGSFNPPPQHFNGFCFFFTPLLSIHPIKTWHERNHCQREHVKLKEWEAGLDQLNLLWSNTLRSEHRCTHRGENTPVVLCCLIVSSWRIQACVTSLWALTSSSLGAALWSAAFWM